MKKPYLLKKLVYRLRGLTTTEELVRRGMKVGKNFYRGYQATLDDLCWLIEIGDNVTLAAGVSILCHDASTKRFLNYSKVGRVTIGDNVFIGAGSVVLPGVTIGSNVIVGANSTVTHDLPDDCVAAGCPARTLYSMEEYLEKERRRMAEAPCFSEAYTLRGHASPRHKAALRAALEGGRIAFID